MNICWCGAQAGYPHDEFCPYPLYRGSEKQEQDWQSKWEANRKAAQQSMHFDVATAGCCPVPLLGNACMYPACELYVPPRK